MVSSGLGQTLWTFLFPSLYPARNSQDRCCLCSVQLLSRRTKKNTNQNGRATRELTNSDDDEPIRLSALDNAALTNRFRLTVIGRVFHTGGRSMEAFLALMPSAGIWDLEGRVRGFDLGNGRFHFNFETEEDLQKVLRKRPCHFNKWTFSLERWKLNFQEDLLCNVNFWVRIRVLPLRCWIEEAFRGIGSALGHVSEVDPTEARVLVALEKICARMPRGQEKFVSIGDLQGWGFSNCDIRGYLAALSTLQMFLVQEEFLSLISWKIQDSILDEAFKNLFRFSAFHSISTMVSSETFSYFVLSFQWSALVSTRLPSHQRVMNLSGNAPHQPDSPDFFSPLRPSPSYFFPAAGKFLTGAETFSVDLAAAKQIYSLCAPYLTLIHSRVSSIFQCVGLGPLTKLNGSPISSYLLSPFTNSSHDPNSISHLSHVGASPLNPLTGPTYGPVTEPSEALDSSMIRVHRNLASLPLSEVFILSKIKNSQLYVSTVGSQTPSGTNI